jgi:uncharacterized protein (TIGR02246 family)
MTTTREGARTPDDITRLFVERANARDAAGMAALYAQDAVMAYPPGSVTVGREAITELCERLLHHLPLPLPGETPRPALHYGNLALTSTPSADGKGERVQVVRREADGTWVRIIDRPEVPQEQP